MRMILLPLDGSANSERAVKHLIRLAEYSQPEKIHLLNVQRPIMSGDISPYVTQEMVETLHREKGEKETAGARALLDDAGIPYEFHIEEGNVAETIARYARENRCDAILMSTRGMGAIGNLVLGSVATKVIHLVEVPVTLVK